MRMIPSQEHSGKAKESNWIMFNVKQAMIVHMQNFP